MAIFRLKQFHKQYPCCAVYCVTNIEGNKFRCNRLHYFIKIKFNRSYVLVNNTQLRLAIAFKSCLLNKFFLTLSIAICANLGV